MNPDEIADLEMAAGFDMAFDDPETQRDDVDSGEVWPDPDPEELEQLAVGDFEPVEEPPPVARTWRRRSSSDARGMDPGLFC